jgi:hypothetical protein
MADLNSYRRGWDIRRFLDGIWEISFSLSPHAGRSWIMACPADESAMSGGRLGEAD